MADQIPRAEPESFRARALSASITVADLEKSAAWYCDAIGFTVGLRYEREGKLLAVRLVAGDVELLLTQDDGAKGKERAKGEGISLMITTAQSVDAVAARIKASGGTLDAEPTDMPWGARAFRFRDPDGFKLTISSERPAGR